MKNPLTLTIMAATLTLGTLGAFGAHAASTDPGARKTIPVGVEESTDPDRIAQIEQRAQDLQARQSDMSQSYEPTGAGKAKHHKHAHKHHAKDGAKAMQATPDQPLDSPAQ